MSAKPPVLGPTTKIAGVASAPSKVTPASSTSYPKTLSNGDILIGEFEQGKHKVQLIEQKDPSQFIKYFGKCSCGVEGRFHYEGQLRDFFNAHFARRVHER